jgi:hypothetical protein
LPRAPRWNACLAVAPGTRRRQRGDIESVAGAPGPGSLPRGRAEDHS